MRLVAPTFCLYELSLVCLDPPMFSHWQRKARFLLLGSLRGIPHEFKLPPQVAQVAQGQWLRVPA